MRLACRDRHHWTIRPSDDHFADAAEKFDSPNGSRRNLSNTYCCSVVRLRPGCNSSGLETQSSLIATTRRSITLAPTSRAASNAQLRPSFKKVENQRRKIALDWNCQRPK